MDLDLKMLSQNDPLNRYVERNEGGEIYSPFDPPAEPLVKESMSYENMHPLLQSFIDEHEEIKKHIQLFDDAIQNVRKIGFTKDIYQAIRNFFESFDQKIIPNMKSEEKFLFLKLHERLIEIGEHSPSEPIQTGVTLLETEHTHVIQMGAVIFNFFALSWRLKDHEAKLQVLDLAIEKALQLIEIIRLHSLREDTVLFPLAQKHLKPHEMTTLLEKRANDA